MQHQVPTAPVRGTTDAYDPDVQKTVELPQVQHTERIIDVRAVMQHQTSVLQRVQETADVPQSQQLGRAGRRGCGDTADVLETKSEREAWRRRYRKVPPGILKLVFREISDGRPSADADDVFATTEYELAMSSGEAVDSRSGASG